MKEWEEEFEGLSVEELEIRLEETTTLADQLYNMEQSIKRILNSIYGAFGNEWFYFFNIDIAEAITGQGRDAILFTEKMLNLYFNDFWHNDTEAHEKLGITLDGKVLKPVVIYIDTDSCYVTFEEPIAKSTWEGTEKEFILKLYEVRLKGYVEKVLERYANDFGSENYLNFELESIARNAMFLAKKKYIQNIAWTDPDIHYDDLSNIKTKGYETIQSSTPTFVRGKLDALVRMIFEQEVLDISAIVKELKHIKDEFRLADIEDICSNLKMNNYEKYILDDQERFEYASGCQPNCRSAGYHNYLLNNSDYKKKYQLIANGEKLKMYYTDTLECDVFGYMSGLYPYEFAPKINYDLQFEKTILDPFNRVLSIIGLQTLDRNLIYASSLWS